MDALAAICYQRRMVSDLAQHPGEPGQRPRLPWVWDYDIDEEQFLRMLRGQLTLGRLDRDWAAVRLIEYAPYEEIVRILGYRDLLRGWPTWRAQVRSVGRKRGFDFLAEWMPRHRPDCLVEH